MIYLIFLCISCLALLFITKFNIKINESSFTIDFGKILTVFLFTLLTASRTFSVGTDTINYIYSAKSIQNNYSSLSSIIHGYYIEPGYGVLEYICMKWLGDVHFLFMFEALILLVGLFCFIHNFENRISIPLAFLVFFSFYFNSSLNISRQYIAVGIGFFAAKFLLENKKISYFICCIAATIFHSTGLLLFISYFISRFLFTPKKNTSFARRVLLLVVGIMGLCMMIRPITTTLASFGVIPAKYVGFLHASEATSSLVLTVLVNLPLLLLLLYLKNQLLEYDERNRIVIALYLIGFFVSLLNTVFGNVGRLAVFWTSWQIILYPECCELLCSRQSSGLSRMLTKIIFVLFFVAYWYYCVIYRGFSATTPYISDVFTWMNWSY